MTMIPAPQSDNDHAEAIRLAIEILHKTIVAAERNNLLVTLDLTAIGTGDFSQHSLKNYAKVTRNY